MSPASSWLPENLVPSAWLGHAPFAFWLLGAARPASFVELGTHHGFSYLVVCQAIRDHHLNATACAIDTWQGDEHAGYYDTGVLADLRRRNGGFSSFSSLLQSSFSDAVVRFDDGSIDLLHIDGLHTYDAVKADFELWSPKVSARGIVLFHDTNAFTQGFGVHRFWGEVRHAYPSFEFLHSGGLGVLVVGERAPDSVRALAATTRRPRVCAAIRRRYETLGNAIARLES